jgi:tetratricopeptide (TPR) repeat protein
VAGTILLPSNNHLLGDGYNILHQIDFVDKVILAEPITSGLFLLLGKILGSKLVAFRIVDVAAGMAYLYLVYLFAKRFESTLEKSIIALTFFSTATIQFYFGYVEFYNLRHLFTFLYIYIAITEINSDRVTLKPLLAFVLAVLSHFTAGVLFPSAVYLYRKKLNLRFISIFIFIAAAGVYVLLKSNVENVFLRLFAGDYSTYTLFAAPHLLDFLNLIFLVTPAVILLAFSRFNRQEHTFLIIAASASLLFSFAVDPRLGAFRDWDLISGFAIPVLALIALSAPRKRLTQAILVMIILVRVVPWVTFNHTMQTGFVKSITKNDIHYTCNYQHGWFNYRWGFLLYSIGDKAGAEEAWKTRLGCDRNDQRTIRMLGYLTREQSRFDESRLFFHALLGFDQRRPDYFYSAALASFLVDSLNEASSIASHAPSTFFSLPEAIRLIAAIKSAEGNYDLAEPIAEKLKDAKDDNGKVNYYLAVSCLRRGNLDLAKDWLNRAIEVDSSNLNYRHLQDSLTTH